ncbi:MAG TPA: DUF3352 domain-containing protein [Cytophagaceae bacterium]
MKKFLLFLSVLLLGLIGYGLYTYYLSPSDNFRSIYLVPKDAVYIIQTSNPIQSWKKISNSKTWKHMQKQPYFAELTSSANSLDSMIQNNEQLFDILGSRSVTVSAHVYAPRKYDFLFIVDLEKASKLNFIQDYFTNLNSSEYRITSRNHNGNKIYEFYNKKDKSTLSLTFIKNLLVCSYINKLVEASIDQQNEPVIGRDLNFIEMAQQVDDDGLFTIYLQYSRLDDLMRCYLAEEDESVNSLSKSLYYTGLNVNLEKDDKLSMIGVTNINDSVSSYLKAMMLSGKGKLNAQKVIPQRTAFYMSLAVDNFQVFYDNFKQLMKEGNAKEYAEYEKNVQQIEKYLKISLQDNFIKWIGNEVAFVQSQPKGLGKENEFAVVIKSKSKKEAIDNLNFIAKQIRKKTPVKFKEFDYKGYPVNFLSVKGMFKVILGNFFKKLDKPYYTVIEEYVVFSNHPQTIKNFIDDYVNQKTLEKSEEFNDFIDNFSTASNIFIYVHPPILHDNLKGFVSNDTWVSVNKNKDYIVCFPHIGFQMNENNAMFETRFISSFRDLTPIAKEQPVERKEFHASVSQSLDTLIEEENTSKAVVIEPDDEIYLDDLDVKFHKEYYDDGSVKLDVDIKNGVKHGNYTEYYPNGKVRIKGKYRNDKKDGTFRFYDEKGKLIEKREYSEGELVD